MALLTRHLPPLLTIAMSVVLGLAAQPLLPPRIPVHWGIDGTISSYASRRVGVFLNPAAMTVAYLFFTLIPYSDKRRVRELRELGVYEPLRNAAVYAFALAQLMAVGIGVGVISPDANYLVAVGSLFAVLGGEAVRSGLLAPLKATVPRLDTVPDERLARIAARAQIAGGFGVLGAFVGWYQPLWFVLPLTAMLIADRRRADA